DVVEAAREMQQLVFVEPARVAGMEKSLGVESPLGRHLDVALHEREALEDHLALLALAQRRPCDRINDAHAVAGKQGSVGVEVLEWRAVAHGGGAGEGLAAAVTRAVG